jgi:glutathione S-transferase
MSLTLHQHPLASFCHKVLIALYENDVAFEARIVDFGDPESSAGLLNRWPVGKIPVLHDRARDRTVAKTSIIIEYLDQHHPGPVRLLPKDSEEALQARLWDRFFDLYVSVPMQKIVTDRIRPEGRNDPFGVEEARATLETAYGMIETELRRRDWASGGAFTIADCAAAPALFYSAIVQPFGDTRPNLAAYFERLIARPSFARVLGEARPYFANFPFVADMPDRFLAERAD